MDQIEFYMSNTILMSVVSDSPYMYEIGYELTVVEQVEKGYRLDPIREAVYPCVCRSHRLLNGIALPPPKGQ